MAFYRQVGSVPPKRHTQHRRPDGGLYSEELMGEEGFSSDSTLLYHRDIPSAIVDARPWTLPDHRTMPNASAAALSTFARSSALFWAPADWMANATTAVIINVRRIVGFAGIRPPL